MKTIYITGCVLFGSILYAQQPIQNQDQVVKKAKEHKTSMAKYHENPPIKSQTTLVSDEGTVVKSQPKTIQTSITPTAGKLLPNTATLHEILETLPNRRPNKKTEVSQLDHVQGLQGTATLQEVLKTKSKEK